MTTRFTSIGNMGCRQWWGEPRTLRPRDLGVWDGRWLKGVNGPRPGRFDLAFENWCSDNGHACLRTVNLFWVFDYHRNGFPTRLDDASIKENWREQKKQRREAPLKIKQGRILHLSFDLKKLSRAELSRYLDDWYPDPGTWSAYCSERRAYFLEELTRYRKVLAFWKECVELRKMFRRCAAFSNRRPESHPDYLVRFRGHDECMFVEVKSPRESLRPSQRQFFPELVKMAGQHVMLVRLTDDGRSVRFFEFTPEGELLPWSPPWDSEGGGGSPDPHAQPGSTRTLLARTSMHRV
jgi:hypothetical protein